MTTWRFLNTGYHDGFFNMDFDVRLARELIEGTGLPTVRVYGWKPYAISLGFNQNSEALNRGKCRQEGIDVVWRPTGGRAVFHAVELTYSVVLMAKGRSVLQTYNDIGGALVRGLRKFNREISLTQAQTDFSRLYQKFSSDLCFSSTSRYEIQYRGKKLVGSAQRRYVRLPMRPRLRQASSLADAGDVVLQHGSILLGPEHKRLPEFLIGDDPLVVQSATDDLEFKTIELSRILGRSVEFSEAAECLQKGFEEEWGIRFESAENFVRDLSQPLQV